MYDRVKEVMEVQDTMELRDARFQTLSILALTGVSASIAHRSSLNAHFKACHTTKLESPDHVGGSQDK